MGTTEVPSVAAITRGNAAAEAPRRTPRGQSAPGFLGVCSRHLGVSAVAFVIVGLGCGGLEVGAAFRKYRMNLIL